MSQAAQAIRQDVMPHHSARIWARTSTVGFILFGVSLMLFMDFLSADLKSLPFVRDNFPIAESELHINHLRLIAGSSLVAITGGVAFVSLLVWQYLATANARAMAPGVRFRPLAAVLSWFVPVANLLLPPLAVGEVWKASDPDAQASEWRGRRATPLVWIWWLAWLAAGVLTYLALRGSLGHTATPEELIARDHVGIGAAVAGIAAAVLSIVLLLRVNHRQLLREDRIIYPDWSGWGDRSPTADEGT